MKAISDYTIQPPQISNIVENDGSFMLSRMKRMMEQSTEEFDQLIASDVVQVRMKIISGKKQGIRINGVMYPLLVIAYGRHRVARAFIEGRTHINVEILS
jgi:hypothetical protein